MIRLLQPLQFDDSTPGNATLILWLCESFDFTFSFRAVLSRLESALGGPQDFVVALPPEEPGEPFVDGHLTWNNSEYELYFESALGYMQFSCSSAPNLLALKTAIAPNLQFQRTPDGAAE